MPGLTRRPDGYPVDRVLQPARPSAGVAREAASSFERTGGPLNASSGFRNSYGGIIGKSNGIGTKITTASPALPHYDTCVIHHCIAITRNIARGRILHQF